MQELTPEEYKNILTDIIKKQIVILGPQIAVLKARNIPGLTVTDDGTVTAVSGNAQDTVQQLIDSYVSLSGEIVKNAVNSVFAKYPSLKKS